MKELLFKSFICIIAIILLVNAFVSFSYAEGDGGTTAKGDGGTNMNDNFDLSKYGNDATPSDGTDSTRITNATRTLAGTILGVVRIIGTGVALIMITVIAMKYMIAAPGDRADIKKSSIQYVVGALIVLGSVQILDLIVELAPKLFSNQ